MQSIVKGLGKVILLAGLTVGALAQPGYLPTVFYPVRAVAPGTITQQTIIIPSSYMIGQYTHTLSINVHMNLGCTISQLNQLVVGLEGSFDNTTNDWTTLGAPISVLTGVANIPNTFTGFTVIYGAAPYLRVNIRRAFGGLNCLTAINYVGSTTPVSFPTSTPQAGDQYTNFSSTGLTNATPQSIITTFALGGKLNIYGVSLHNEDTTNPTTYTLQLYANGSGSCTTGGSGAELDIGVYRVAAGGTFTLGFNSVPIFQFPNTLFNSTAGGLDVYNATTGFYQVCLVSSAAVSTSMNVVSRAF